MSEYRIYFIDTSAPGDARIEYARGLDHTRAHALVSELNSGFCARGFNAPNAGRKTTALHYWTERVSGSDTRWMTSNATLHVTTYENQSDAQEAQDGSLPGDHQGYRGAPDVHRHRAHLEKQPQDEREIHVRSAGPQLARRADEAKKSRRRNPTFNSSDHHARNPTFNA
jgi:hypothetical protein